jgi:NTE family protein
MKKLGIALGGGGTRGFAHLGVLKALREKGIEPEIFSGTSAGAIVAALLAAKINPDTIMETMNEINITDAAKLNLDKRGLASLENLKNLMDEILKGKNFSDLAFPLYLCVSNLNTGKVEYMNSGNVAVAVQASASIPILFSPVEINGQLYVDGGLLDNVPVKPLINQCERIIAVDIMPVQEMKTIDGISDMIIQVLQMNVSMQNENKEDCDLLINVEGLSEYTLLDTNNNEKIFEIGYNYAKNLEIPNLAELTS